MLTWNQLFIISTSQSNINVKCLPPVQCVPISRTSCDQSNLEFLFAGSLIFFLFSHRIGHSIVAEVLRQKCQCSWELVKNTEIQTPLIRNCWMWCQNSPNSFKCTKEAHCVFVCTWLLFVFLKQAEGEEGFFCVCMCVDMCVHICRGHSSTLGVISQTPSTFSLTEGLSLAWNSPSRLG